MQEINGMFDERYFNEKNFNANEYPDEDDYTKHHMNEMIQLTIQCTNGCILLMNEIYHANIANIYYICKNTSNKHI